MARTVAKAKSIDNLGNVAGSDVIGGYQAANIEESMGGTSYYGFVDTDGNWYIQRATATDIDFASGTSNYSTNWTNRTSLTYGKFNTVF